MEEISLVESNYLLGGEIQVEGPTSEVEGNSFDHVPSMKDSQMCLSTVATSGDTIVVCGESRSYMDIASYETFSSSYQRKKKPQQYAYIAIMKYDQLAIAAIASYIITKRRIG